MFVDSSVTRLNGKTYARHLLRETYREDGKVKHRTLANLTHCKPEEVEAIRLALKHKGDLGRMLASAGESGPELKQGPSVGAVWVLSQLARELGVVAALGSDRQGKLALWQIIARVLDQGSRLSAVRLAGGHAVGAALGMVGFDEDGLYHNLDWLADNQAEIESRLFAQREPASAPDVFLYDVTSTYLEGEHNAFAAFGYNRDRKSGKRQIVIGLLADADGRPLSIEVFKGNTPDVKTFSSQVNKAAARFGAERVTFVGDRGMIKAPQRAEITAAGFHYITAITKAQIDGLIAAGVLQMDLFEDALAEVEGLDGERYVVRRNPARAEELAASRADKLTRLHTSAETANAYLNEHPRAAAKTQLARLKAKSETLGLDKVLQVAEQARRVVVTVDEAALAEAARLDGCYALRTDLPKTVVGKEIVHDRYKDLAHVEWTFRELQIRATRDAAGLSARREPHARPRPRRHAGLSPGARPAPALARHRPDRAGRPRPARQSLRRRSDHRRSALLQSGPDAARRRAPIVRSRRRRHSRRAAPRPGPRSHQANPPTATKS